MATNNLSLRAPGSFSPSIGSVSSPRSGLSGGGGLSSPNKDLAASRPQKPRLNTNVLPYNHPISAHVQQPRPFHAFSQGNLSASSLQSFNFSRPTGHSGNNRLPELPPLRLQNQSIVQNNSNLDYHRHRRKHSSTQGSFEAYLPTTASNNLGNVGNLKSGLSASHIAAQSTIQHQTHTRQRSQTVPSPQAENERLRSSSKGDPNTLMLSLIEASISPEYGLVTQAHQKNFNGEAHGNAVHAAANVVFTKSPVLSPGLSSDYSNEKEREKLTKTEKSKVKLFSRPSKIGISREKETKIGPISSPSMNSFSPIQKTNYSNLSVSDIQTSNQSIYSMANSSAVTIRPVEAEEKKIEKEKHKHHFLSRQKHKLISKDDHNLLLSSAASNSKPVDPSAPSSLYNFNTPLTLSANSTASSRSMPGLDFRHGGRVLRDRKKEKEEKVDRIIREDEISYQNGSNEKIGTTNLTSSSATSFLAVSSVSYASSICGYDTPTEITKNGLDRMGPEDAWPFIKTKLLTVFEGEDIRLPVEDLNKIVSLHLQAVHRKRAHTKNLTDDLLDLLHNGFTLLNRSLRCTPDEHLIPQLAEMWIFTFTVILPFMQAVFLPLDLEISQSSNDTQDNNTFHGDLSVRSMVLRSYRDVIILSRFNTLKDHFSQLHLERKSNNLLDQSMHHPDFEFAVCRPATAMSLDPGIARYEPQGPHLVDSFSPFNRGRAFSSVSNRVLTELPGMSSLKNFRLSEREQIIEDDRDYMSQITGRLLQCIGVLNSVHDGTDDVSEGECIKEKMSELARGLKLDWLERERIGPYKRGLVRARVRVPVSSFGAAIEV